MNKERPVRRPSVSFILRLWPHEGASHEMRGEVEHIATGEKRAFIDHRSLLSLLETWQREREVVR